MPYKKCQLDVSMVSLFTQQVVRCYSYLSFIRLMIICYLNYIVNLMGEFDSKFSGMYNSNRKAMNRNWSNQKANPALKTKTGNK